MDRIRILFEAEREYQDSLLWYAMRSHDAAEAFQAEFERKLEAIQMSPRRFPTFDGVHRFCSMGRFPFQLIFREKAEEILIVAVAHAKRRPGYWKER